MFFDFLFAMLLPGYLTNSNSSIVSGDENEDGDDVGDYDDDYDDEIRNEDENDGDDDNVDRKRNRIMVKIILTFCRSCAPLRRNR